MAEILLTCAIIGAFTTRQHTPHAPITPAEIARDCLAAAEAGATIVHIHVRDPESGAPSMEVAHYREVVERIRDRNDALILNLTAGPGARYHPTPGNPALAGPRTNLLPAAQRVEHVMALRPDIATIDLNTMIFGREIVINTLESIREMGALMAEAGTRPEYELFDSGDISILNDLVADGSVRPDPLCSLVMGVKHGFQPSPETLLYARGLLPRAATWTAFATSRWAFPMLALAATAGGNVRIGLEDGVFLSRGQLASSNAAMVEKARRMLDDLGVAVMSPAAARRHLGLRC